MCLTAGTESKLGGCCLRSLSSTFESALLHHSLAPKSPKDILCCPENPTLSLPWMVDGSAHCSDLCATVVPLFTVLRSLACLPIPKHFNLDPAQALTLAIPSAWNVLPGLTMTLSSFCSPVSFSERSFWTHLCDVAPSSSQSYLPLLLLFLFLFF